MMTIDQCREILGASAATMTDAEVETLRDGLERAADELHASMTEALATGTASLQEWQDVALLDSDIIPPWLNTNPEQAKRDAIERLRWIAHTHDTGEVE